MLVPHHIVCQVCGARSVTVQDRYQITGKEKQLLEEFVDEHTICAKSLNCALESTLQVLPDGWQPPTCGPFGDAKPSPKSTRKPHGYFEFTGPYGETLYGDTVSCCHCRKHVLYSVVTEKELGFCALCYNGTTGSGTTCGHPHCLDHLPFEERLCNLEAGKPEFTPLTAKIAVPNLPDWNSAVVLEPPAAFASTDTVTLTCGEQYESSRAATGNS